MNRYPKPRLENRYKSMEHDDTNVGKSVIDLALKAYQSENLSTETIPAAFREVAVT